MELAKAVQIELTGARFHAPKFTGSPPHRADHIDSMHACRELAKAVQTELAGANAVAEEALSSMVTVRSHAAEDSTRAAYAQCLRAFYMLQVCLPLCVLLDFQGLTVTAVVVCSSRTPCRGPSMPHKLRSRSPMGCAVQHCPVQQRALRVWCVPAWSANSHRLHIRVMQGTRAGH